MTVFFFSANFWPDFYFFFPGKVYKSLTPSIENTGFFPAREKKPGFFTNLLQFGKKNSQKTIFSREIKKEPYL